MAQQRYTITGFVIDEDTYDFKDTTTGNATTTEPGFMSAADKVSLDDVVHAISNMYTKAQTDAAIAQSTANLMESGTWTPVIKRITITTITRATWYRTGNLVFASATFTTGALPSGVSASDNVYIEQSSYPIGGGTGVADTSVVDGVWENATSAIGGIIASSGANNNGWFFGTIMTTDYETHRLRADKLVNSTVTIHLRYAVNV